MRYVFTRSDFSKFVKISQNHFVGLINLFLIQLTTMKVVVVVVFLFITVKPPEPFFLFKTNENNNIQCAACHINVIRGHHSLS